MNTLIPNLHVEYRPTGSLRPAKRNPRTHSPKQIQQLVESMKTFGFTTPILLGADNRVLAGHGRLAAAKALGFEHVPTIRVDHLTESQRRTYLLADNKLTELAGWDQDLLALELKELGMMELEFDLTVTGFETGEIDWLIDQAALVSADPAADVVPPVESIGPPISQLGDLWALGSHRLLCGNATEHQSFLTLMALKQAHMVFLDPPYNVPIPGHVSGLGAVQHGNFAMATGEMSEAEFVTFLRTIFAHLVAHCHEGAIHFICMDWRHLHELFTAARAVYTEIKNLCVWKKNNGGMGTFYRSQHELVLVAKQGTAPHINNFELGQHGRYRTNVWEYPGLNAFQDDRQQTLALHPTVKPVALIADAIKDCSPRGGLILDSCAGSGTTVIAAEQTGRTAYLMELDPRYVDTIIGRWQAYTGQVARHEPTGRTWMEVQEARAHGHVTG